MVAKDRFVTLTDTVINNFEGGYYHPRMKAGKSAADQKILGDSGETMFGLDRKHGASLAKWPEWAEFWRMIDNAGASRNWKHYFRGGALEKSLKVLAAKIMYNHFVELANKHLSPKAKQALANDDRLVIHYSYASWNGPLWFELFTYGLNDALNAGVTDKEKLYEAAIKSRTYANQILYKDGKAVRDAKGRIVTRATPNNTIRLHGNKMVALFNKMFGGGEKKKPKPFIDAFDWLSWSRGL